MSYFSSKITDLILDSDNDLKYLIFPNLLKHLSAWINKTTCNVWI